MRFISILGILGGRYWSTLDIGALLSIGKSEYPHFNILDDRRHVIVTTYTESDVPITIKQSAFSRSDSKLRRTLSCNVSPKKVTPGFSTPPHIPFESSGYTVRRFLLGLAGWEEDWATLWLLPLMFALHRGTTPWRMDGSIADAATFCLHLVHDAHCSDPCA